MSEFTSKTPAPIRTIVEITSGYKEVNLAFRRARAEALSSVADKKGRIRCPVVDASRRTDVYWMKAMPSTDLEGLTKWCSVLPAAPVDIVKHLAYISGPFCSIIPNEIHGVFDDQAINHGFIASLKNGVNSNILNKFYFDQEKFNELVWAVYPDLKGIAMTEKYLYSENGNGLFLKEEMIDNIVSHDTSNSEASSTCLGPMINNKEWTPLFNNFGQTNVADNGKQNSTGKVLLIRDLYDLYKYGLFSALREEDFLTAGLLNGSSPGFTARPMSDIGYDIGSDTDSIIQDQRETDGLL